jgi:hypothetical protein
VTIPSTLGRKVSVKKAIFTERAFSRFCNSYV